MKAKTGYTVMLDADLHAALQARARRHDRSMAWIIIETLRKELGVRSPVAKRKP